MATASDSHKDAMRAGKVDGIDDVGNSGTLNYQCRVFVDQRVVVPSRHIVVRITRAQYPATQTTFKFLDDQGVQFRRFNSLNSHGSFLALATPLWLYDSVQRWLHLSNGHPGVYPGNPTSTPEKNNARYG